jgi:hypothetical protein
MSKGKSFVKKILEVILAFSGLLKRGESMGLDSAI